MASTTAADPSSVADGWIRMAHSYLVLNSAARTCTWLTVNGYCERIQDADRECWPRRLLDQPPRDPAAYGNSGAPRRVKGDPMLGTRGSAVWDRPSQKVAKEPTVRLTLRARALHSSRRAHARYNIEAWSATILRRGPRGPRGPRDGFYMHQGHQGHEAHTQRLTSMPFGFANAKRPAHMGKHSAHANPNGRCAISVLMYLAFYILQCNHTCSRTATLR